MKCLQGVDLKLCDLRLIVLTGGTHVSHVTDQFVDFASAGRFIQEVAPNPKPQAIYTPNSRTRITRCSD